MNEILSKNRKCMFAKVKSSLNLKWQIKDLIENLVENEKKDLSLFGEYSLSILKRKNILENYKLALPKEFSSFYFYF